MSKPKEKLCSKPRRTYRWSKTVNFCGGGDDGKCFPGSGNHQSNSLSSPPLRILAYQQAINKSKLTRGVKSTLELTHFTHYVCMYLLLRVLLILSGFRQPCAKGTKELKNKESRGNEDDTTLQKQKERSSPPHRHLFTYYSFSY